MKNPYEERSIAWHLLEAGDQLAESPATDDRVAEAIHTLTVAIYTVGAALADGLDDVSRSASD